MIFFIYLKKKYEQIPTLRKHEFNLFFLFYTNIHLFSIYIIKRKKKHFIVIELNCIIYVILFNIKFI